MTVNQVYTIVNTMASEMLGEEAVVKEDLSNVVELGESFQNAVGLDNYVRSLTDHIGRMVFVDRAYTGRAPSVLMDGWEYGSVMQKVSTELPDATENESWELTAGTSYDPNIFYKPVVTAKFWNKRVTFEIPMSITERQVKSAFDSVTQLNAFFSMIYTSIQNGMTIYLDGLIMRTINVAMAETIYSDYPGGAYTAGSGVKAVNLLYLYNQLVGGDNAITVSTALSNEGFIRFASYTMANYMDRIQVMSTLFNVESKERFTPRDKLHVVMLSEFKNAANMYLQSSTFHDEYTALPNAESVSYWQGSGVNYAFNSTSNINVTTAEGHGVNLDGILCVMFDRDALGVACMNRRVTTNYNAKAEFWNQWNKMDANYFVDSAENTVVFFIK